MSDLRIQSTGPAPWDTKVYLDGHEVRGLVQLRFQMDRDRLNYCEITIEPGRVDVDTEALKALTAYLECREVSRIG
jgi:hypothetical protein